MLKFSQFFIQISIKKILIFLLIFKFVQCENRSDSLQELKRVYPGLHGDGDHDDMDYNFLIVGGYRPKTPNLTKYLVSVSYAKVIRYFGDSHFCGGAIVKPNIILTALHCMKGYLSNIKSPLNVIAGTPNRLVKTEKTQIVKVKRYKKIDPLFEKPDIAMLILEKSLIIDNVTTAILPLARSKPVANMKCTILGWGRIFHHGPSPAQVIYADVHIWDDRQCSSYKVYLPSVICAGEPSDPDRDSCSGDSGGPLICDYQLYGVVSFGIGCGTPGFPGFYVNVWKYKRWIERENRAYLYEINYIFYACLMALYLVLK